jgi:hypothetical protein
MKVWPGGRFPGGAAVLPWKLSNVRKMADSPIIVSPAVGACVLSRAGWEKLLPLGVDPATDHVPSRFVRAYVSCIVPDPFFT